VAEALGANPPFDRSACFVAADSAASVARLSPSAALPAHGAGGMMLKEPTLETDMLASLSTKETIIGKNN
jgi:hypothetical protein